MGGDTWVPRRPPGRPAGPLGLPGWGALLLFLLLATSTVALFHLPAGSAGTTASGSGAGSTALSPYGATAGNAHGAGLPPGAPTPRPGTVALRSSPPVSLEQALWGVGMGGLAAVGFSLRFRKRKEEGTASSSPSGRVQTAASQSPSTGGNAGSTGRPSSASPSKTLGGLEGLSEAAPAPPLPDMSPPSSRAPSGAGPTPLVVPVDQAICPLCGGPLNGPNAPCPNCTPSLVPGPTSAAPEASDLPAPGSKGPPPDLSPPAAGDGRRGLPSVLPATPSPASARCMVCGGPLKEGYCPVCGMRWSE